MNHRWRKNKRAFDGTQELEGPPDVPDGVEILRQLDEKVFGDEDSGRSEKRQKIAQEKQAANDDVVWKKKSIFFRLPYWKDNLLRHNLDVMHIEKNVMENIIGTLLNIKEKTKDNFKARQDLQEMGLRHELHPYTDKNGKTYMPAACYTMSNENKNNFLQVLKDVRVPDGYASNISRCVRERNLVGLKSHDHHIIMQQLLPIALRGNLPNNVVGPIVELSTFFRGICSTTSTQEDMD
jgi:hypothetical protein